LKETDAAAIEANRAKEPAKADRVAVRLSGTRWGVQGKRYGS
jgi:hypothetical protein